MVRWFGCLIWERGVGGGLFDGEVVRWLGCLVCMDGKGGVVVMR